MIDIKKYNRIVSFGCSWTAGDEIKDHEILGISYQKCKKMKIKYGSDKFYQLKDKNQKLYGNLIEENFSINSNSTWAALLSKKLHLDFENRAIGGSSLDQILFTILQDLKNNNIKNSDLILVGLTTPFRTLLWPNKFQPYSVIPGVMDCTPNNVKKWCLQKLWTDNNFSLNWIKTIQSISNLSDNIFFIFPRPECSPIYYQYNISSEIKFYYEFIMDKLSDRFLSSHDLFLELETYEHCGFGHPPYESHEKLADKLFEKIYGDKND